MIKNKNIKNFLIYTFFGFFQKGISFFMFPIYTILLSPEEFGLANQVIAVGSIYILFFTFALDEAAAKFYFKFRDNLLIRGQLIGSIIAVNFLLVIIGCICIYVLRDFFYIRPIKNIEDQMILFSILLVSSAPLFFIYQKILRIKEKAKEFSIIMITYSISQIIFAIILIVVFNLSSAGLILSHTLTSMLIFLYCLYKLSNEEQIQINKNRVFNILKYSAPILPHKISSWGLAGFSIIIIGYFLDSSAVGIYSAAAFLGVIIDSLSKSFLNAYQPWIYNKLEKGNKGKKNVIDLSRSLGIYVIIFSLILSIFCNEIMRIFINERYYSGIIISPLIIFTSVTLFIGSLFTFVLYYYEDAGKYVSLATIIGAVANILLSFTLIPLIGLFGAVISLSFGIFLESSIKHWYACKCLNSNRLFFDLYLFSICIAFIGVANIHYETSLLLRFFIFLIMLIFICFIYFRDINYLLIKLRSKE